MTATSTEHPAHVAGQHARRHRHGVPWTEARTRAARAEPPGPVRLPLGSAEGSCLAADATAPLALPTADTSAMDGFAVGGAGPWRITGRLDAGHGTLPALGPGEAVRISTGALVPDGADAVLPVEDALVLDGRVHGEAAPGRHIRRRGEDVRPGVVLLPKGTRLGPSGLGLLASVGYDHVLARPRPSCVLLMTGDELLTRGTPHGGLVRDAVGPMLPGLLERLGCTAVGARHVRDTPASELADAFEQARADIVVVCGATSAGPTDRLRPLLAALGARTAVDQVACRPGHPMLLAQLDDGRWVVGLPGNPFAALVAVHTLLAPLADALQGRPAAALPWLRIHGAPRTAAGQTRILPARWHEGGVEALPADRPASLQAAARADVLVVVDTERLGGDRAELLATL